LVGPIRQAEQGLPSCDPLHHRVHASCSHQHSSRLQSLASREITTTTTAAAAAAAWNKAVGTRAQRALANKLPQCAEQIRWKQQGNQWGLVSGHSSACPHVQVSDR
jgi:hypothetical protein